MLSAMLLLLAVVAPAKACPIIEPPDWAVVVRIEAVSAGHTGIFEEVFTPGTRIDPIYEWALSDSTSLQDSGGNTIATLHNLGILLDADPAVSLSFEVEAGAETTAFAVYSAVIPFSAIHNPLAYATAAVTVTDQNANGATLTGLYDGAKAYRAIYNSTGVFADLVSPVSVLPDDSDTGSERYPSAGRTTISADVSSIESQFQFTLSPHDSASGTSRFDIIVPEPGTLALLVAGAALACRRRNRVRADVRADPR